MSDLHPDIEWQVEPGLTDYAYTVEQMGQRAHAIFEGALAERIWLVEHPPLYTGGTSARADELLNPRFPVYNDSGRGGRYTYHGPGQRVGYVQLNLAQRGRDVRCYVHALENWVIATLSTYGLDCFAVPGRVGIWTKAGGEEAKIGAIGVRVKKWVTLHGFAVNLSPDLSHFGGIVPCGLPDFAVTSLEKLGLDADMARFDDALLRTMPQFLDSLRCATIKHPVAV